MAEQDPGTDWSTDVYQESSAPDTPQAEPGRMDSGADVAIAAATLVQNTDVIY